MKTLVPGPETYAALGFAAGMALAKLGSRAHAAVEGAYRWRFDLVPHDMDHWIESEPIAFGLARAAAQLPNGKKLIAAYSATDNYQLNALLAHAKAWKATIDPSARQLKQQLRAHDTNVTITLFDKRLVCVVEDFRVGGVLRDSSFTHQGPLSADLDTVATTLCMIGFVPISAQPTLSSKKARS